MVAVVVVVVVVVLGRGDKRAIVAVVVVVVVVVVLGHVLRLSLLAVVAAVESVAAAFRPRRQNGFVGDVFARVCGPMRRRATNTRYAARLGVQRVNALHMSWRQQRCSAERSARQGGHAHIDYK